MNITNIAMNVRRAVAKVCMDAGVEDVDMIQFVSVKAISGMGKMTIAAYKAHNTMRKNRKQRNYRR